VSTPCRSSRVSARACARIVAAAPSASVTRSGSSDQRPVTVGGPLRDGIAARRAPPPYRLPAGRGLNTPPAGADLGGIASRDGTERRGAAGRRVAAPPLVTTRSGARVSLVSQPAHTRSQMAAARSASSAGCPSRTAATRSLSIRKKSAPPPPSAVSTAPCSGVVDSSPGSGSSSGALSAGARTSQPSPVPTVPAPAQTTSPAVVSSSSMAGE